jgi:hypothetical protein
MKLLIEQLEAGHSKGLTAYLIAMGRFHKYSFGNILEIAQQKPDATRVAGMYAWNQLGRKVIKGQKGTRGDLPSHLSERRSCPSLLRSILVVLLLLLVDLLLTLQDLLHELQLIARRRLACAEGILNRLGP